MTRPRPFLAALVSIASCAIAAGSANAATLPDPVWLAPEAAGSAGAASSAESIFAGASATGGSMYAWTENHGTVSSPRIELHLTYRPAGGEWGEPMEISNPTETIYPNGLTTTPDGTITISYATSDGKTWVRDLSASGALADPVLMNPPNASAGCGNVTTGADGTSYLVFCSSETWLRIRPAGSAVWGDAVQIGESGTDSPRIAVDDDGSLAVTYRNSNTNEVRAIVRPAGDDWSDPVTLGTDPDESNNGGPVFDGDGRVVVFFTEKVSGISRGYAAVHDAAGWAPARQLGGDGVIGGTLATDGDGDVLALWVSTDGATYNFHNAELRGSETDFDDPSGFDRPGEMTGASSAARRPDGSMIAPLLHGTGMNDLHLGPIMRPANEAGWSEPQDLEVTSLDVFKGTMAAADGAGDAFVGWVSADGTPMIAAGDASGPVVSDVTVPTAAKAGDRVTVSASALDTWSEVASVAWDFGDGVTTTGETASHTYTAGGTYNVKVTATDAVGHSTSKSKTITVTAPPAPPASNDDGDDTTLAPKPPVTLPPVIEARLAGRTVTLNTKITLRSGKRCSGTVKATTAFGGRSYKVTLRLATKAGACRATGTIKLKKTPSLRTKLRVTVSGAQVKTRAVTTRRG